MEANYSKILKNIIEFMWKSYGVSIIMSTGIEIDKNILGKFVKIPVESRIDFKSINIDLNNIELTIPKKDIESGKFFVVLHEIAHFLLDKSGYIQKEDYADMLACLLAKKLLNKKEFLSFFKSHLNKLISCQILEIGDKPKKELIEINELFFYKYTKYLKLRGEL